jgi:hypothetical protein
VRPTYPENRLEVSGAGFSGSSLRRDIEIGQREQDHPAILGAQRQPQKCRKGVSYTRRRSAPSVTNNDETQSSV